MKSDITQSIMNMLTNQGKDKTASKENVQVTPPTRSLLDTPQPEHSMSNVTDTSNMSETNTIDDNVPALSPQNSLNCLAKTTQLQQLRHIQQPFQH